LPRPSPPPLGTSFRAAALARYIAFDRAEWARLRGATPLTLTEADLERLRGINVSLSLREVEEVYLPLSRLLNLYVAAAQELYRVSDVFLGRPASKVPYVIGIGGSVAVGKSTTARVLHELLARWPNHPRVDLVTTDGFLFPNAELEARGLMTRKGFPESYDTRRLVHFLGDVKAGRAHVEAPVYSHQVYDIVTGQHQVVNEPDILIIEGLNVLQSGSSKRAQVFVSDFFDFSIYVDADEGDIRSWYVERFLKLRETVFRDPASYFRRYADLTIDAARAEALRIWEEINGPNLRQNIEPTRERAHLLLRKGPRHVVSEIKLRKI
jgi:type I pantothenate kinase